jgi:xylan 1,4-beta-xylosidase
MAQTRTFRNPILPGFYPDPSVCRVGEDYYLVTSSFEYFPGLPLFHSRDLVNWRQLGHVLTRPSQLNLDGVRCSGGLYAPTIRHHNGVFYVINTLIDGKETHGNFIVTATDINGPWSEPLWLPEARGIDPSLYFDDETGKVWYVGNRGVAKPEFSGHCEIWLQELDLATMRLTGPDYALWEGALKRAVWPEGPHLYKRDGYFYLLISEAGTGHDHALSIARSESITGPYEGCTRNPILTHRHLGESYPIVGVGHADLVETPSGECWLVLLGMRPYGGYFYNLGRETFLVPVTWESGWPVVNAGVGKVEFEGVGPSLPEHPWPMVPAHDDFDSETLADTWNVLRTPREPFWSLTERASHLRLALRPVTLAEVANPSFVGRRQQHITFIATARLEFTPQSEHECAGLVLLQNNNFQFRLTVTLDPESGGRIVQLIQRKQGEESILAQQALPDGPVSLRVTATGQAYNFAVGDSADNWQPLAEDIDGRILSTPVAGGFVGTYIGLYASSNGQSRTNHADFDWFEYHGVQG